MSLVKNCVFTFAYHRGRWVRVPMLPGPSDIIEDNQNQKEDAQKANTAVGRCCKEAYAKIDSLAEEYIDPETISEKDLTDLCAQNDLPIGWITDRFPKKIRQEVCEKRLDKRKRKFSSLGSAGYKLFIRELRSICKKSAVIAEIMWFLNSTLSADNYITVEELVRLRLNNVSPEDGIYSMIMLSRSSLQRGHLLGYELPEYIWNPLCELIRSDSLYIFSNKNGGPLLPENIQKNFIIAGKMAGLKEPVSSLSLRPTKPSPFREITLDEWDMLIKRVPNLISRRGTPSQYDRRNILNAILYHLLTGTPMRNLPFSLPFRAIDSQYRRWLKNGVIDAVLKVRE